MDYIIAGIRIAIPDDFAEGHFAQALGKFRAEDQLPQAEDSAAGDAHKTPEGPTENAPALILRRGTVVPGLEDYHEIAAFDFPDADADCRFGRDAAGYLFEMAPRSGGAAARMRMEYGSPEVVTDLASEHNPAMVRFGLWMVFNIAAAPLLAIAVHSSVIACNGGAVMFLGESGTGKSTHTRLWRENIPGATLLNDDSPIVCFRGAGADPQEGQHAFAAGSPWSGKTPCYKDLCLPIRGIVRLSQAPHNRMRRLSPIEAIGALLPSCPPAFAHDERLQDAVCATISGILSEVPAYHLECLPDAAAARLAYMTVFGTAPGQDTAAGQAMNGKSVSHEAGGKE